ncbi:MAG: sarcosine oxidase subunit alpha [Gammaproteobacteria bacterium]|jgi:sarcosine oxidase subunit alpha
MIKEPLARVTGVGRIDRSAPIQFTFDGVSYTGYHGDTLASALVANGVVVVGRSFKYHRPRGLYASGPDEPNALVTIDDGPRREPNLRATEVELYEGLCASSQNRWPSLSWDVGAVAGWFSRMLPAGFYYKTFMWPQRGWRFYEWFIRRAAGLGTASREADPDTYAHHYAHYDVVVVGAGPSGLAAARAAARAKARVLLVEQSSELGGSLWRMGEGSAQTAGTRDWAKACIDELTTSANVEVLVRTAAFGFYDHNMLTLSERVRDHLPVGEPASDEATPRQRLWYVRAGEVVLATGASERPLVFAGNDRPGVMLASAAARFLNEFAVTVGNALVVFTTNDSVYPAVLELTRAGAAVLLVVDAREGGPSAHWAQALAAERVELLCGHAVIDTFGGPVIEAVEVQALGVNGQSLVGPGRRVECDGLLVSGGWTPNVQLFAQAQGQLVWDDEVHAFVPSSPQRTTSNQRVCCVGSMCGVASVVERVAAGLEQGANAAQRAGYSSPSDVLPDLSLAVAGAPPSVPALALWIVPQPAKRIGKRFVDFQNDVTAEDIGLAVSEGYHSVEHLKRYTTLGMGTDQGRLSNINGLANLAIARSAEIPDVGLTTFRPPYSPVTLGLLAGAERGAVLTPERLTPLHDWHVARGAKMNTVGRWYRPECYPGVNESVRDAGYREALQVRTTAGVVDVSTLGKIEIQGPDSAEFLERVYVNRWRRLPVGRARYGLMLRDDGMVMDDGTTTRISDQHYYMTTTTGQAEAVMAHLEYHAQVVWPELDIDMVSVSDQWGAFALAGPRSRDVLGAVADAGVSDEALPFMGYVETAIAGVACRVFRLTFSGELAYEVHVPAGFTLAVWQAVLRAGEAFGITPYGTEAMAILRIEKGHVVGSELDGRTTVADLGLGGLARKDGEFIGAQGQARPALSGEGRLELVGVRSCDPHSRVPRGGQLIEAKFVASAMSRTTRTRVPTLGHMTSVTYSPALDAHIGLALVRDGRERIGERVHVASPVSGVCVEVELVHHVFVDPTGERARG